MTTPPQAKEPGTPRTDALAEYVPLDEPSLSCSPKFGYDMVPASFARTLERELAAAQESLRLANMSDYDRRQEAKEHLNTPTVLKSIQSLDGKLLARFYDYEYFDKVANAERQLAEAVAALRIAEDDLREERQQNGQFGAGA